MTSKTLYTTPPSVLPPPQRLQCLPYASPMPLDRLHRAVRLRTDANIDLSLRVRRERSIWRSLSRDSCDEAMHSIAQQYVPVPNAAVHHLYCQRFETVCELRCSSTACESATRSHHAVGRHNMRARTSTDPQADPRYRASTASAKSASSRSLSIVAAGVSWLLPDSRPRRRTPRFSGASFSHGVFNQDRRVPLCGLGLCSASRAMRCRGSAASFAPS